MSRISDQSKRSLWAKRLSRFRNSGLSIARFCLQENIPTHSFHYWAKQLGGHGQQAQMPEVDLVANQPATSTTDSQQIASVAIHCHQHLTLTVPAQCVDTIRAILRELLDRGTSGDGTGGDGRRSVMQQPSTGFRQVVVRPSLASRLA